MWNRFWSKVDASRGIDECWPWVASCVQDGYGQFWLNGTQAKSHRVAYELIVGQIPAGLTIDHLCRNRSCVNPFHMEAVTHRENIMRGTGLAPANAAKAECPRCGSGFKQYWHKTSSSWKRFCAPCSAEAQRKKFADPMVRDRYNAGQRITRARLRERRRAARM